MAPKQNGSGRLLTVKEFADLEGISTQAIYKRLTGQLKNYVVYIGKDGKEVRIKPEGLSDKAREKLPTSYQPNEQQVGNQNCKKEEKDRQQGDFLVGNHGYQPVTNHELEKDEKASNKANILVGNQETEDLRDMIRILKDQMQTKDEQIRAKDDQIATMNQIIADMTKTMENMTLVTGQAQILQGHTQQMLVEKNSKPSILGKWREDAGKWWGAVAHGVPVSQDK